MTPRLITIPFSHYCDKARWALERCGVMYVEEGHLPLFHYAAAFRAGGGRTVPVLVTDDGVLRDSTDIAAWADARRPGALLPADPAERADALALEDELDRQLGPATRRWAYAQLLPKREAEAIMLRGVPHWQRRVLPLARPIAIAFLRRGLNITPAGVDRSRGKIDATFARVGERLRDGRRFLVGNTLTIADITFAALAAPAIAPDDEIRALLPAAEVDTWRATPAGQFALRVHAARHPA
jgi:glutathione S-transferase